VDPFPVPAKKSRLYPSDFEAFSDWYAQRFGRKHGRPGTHCHKVKCPGCGRFKCREQLASEEGRSRCWGNRRA